MDNNKIIPIHDIHPQVRIVNYFTLDKKRNSWGPREIPDFEMILIRDGTFIYDEHEVSETSFPHTDRNEGELLIDLNPGDVLLIPPGVNHTFRSVSGSGAISCIHCLPREYGGKPLPTSASASASLTYLTRFHDKIDLIDHLFYWCSELFSSYNPLKQELLSTVCREIWLLCASQWTISPDSRVISPRMEKMMMFIKENVTKDIGRKELAKRFNLTPEHVNSLFRKELGISPTSCINRERILLGYSKIHNEGLSVKEAAYFCGFNDPFYFSRVFKKILGVAPETLRGRKFFH